MSASRRAWCLRTQPAEVGRAGGLSLGQVPFQLRRNRVAVEEAVQLSQKVGVLIVDDGETDTEASGFRNQIRHDQKDQVMDYP